ncbi:sulfotransferase, partial [Vibrio parahaemolyticus]
TLLSAILRQNPRFSAGMSSPVAMLALTLIPKMASAGEFGAMFTDERRRSVLRSVFEGYYAGNPAEVIFDTNRTWSSKLPL